MSMFLWDYVKNTSTKMRNQSRFIHSRVKCNTHSPTHEVMELRPLSFMKPVNAFGRILLWNAFKLKLNYKFKAEHVKP